MPSVASIISSCLAAGERRDEVNDCEHLWRFESVVVDQATLDRAWNHELGVLGTCRRCQDAKWFVLISAADAGALTAAASKREGA